MKKYTGNYSCTECGKEIEEKVHSFSETNFGVSLCWSHQDWVREKLNEKTVTDESIRLYLALRKREVPAEFQKSDGFKTIDIVVEHAKVHIEVDGAHHNFDPRQALADLKRAFYSFRDGGYLTLRIPNSLVRNDLEETADFIADFLVQSRNRNTVSN